MKKRILLITPENKEINSFRKKQFNNFVQITMPYLSAFIDTNKYEITLIDEYNQKVPYDEDFHLVAITVNTSNATHCYHIAESFRARGIKVVMGGPYATLLPEEVKENCDHIIIGEGEIIWPEFLEDFYQDIGIESFSQDSLGSVNKSINDVDKYKMLIDKIHSKGICVQAGIIFGFDTDKKDIFKKTLDACNELGIDGVTVSILTPLPKTPIYNQLKEENRLLTEDWSYYNGKTRVAFSPKNMTADELF